MPACATPGTGLPVSADLAAAMSPTTKTSGWPGIVRSGPTTTRPARSSGTPSDWPSGLALTPAAQKTLRTGMNSSPMETPCGVTLVTIEFRRTSTPMRSRSRWARALSSGGNGGSTRSAPSKRIDAGRPRVDVLVVLREGLPGDLLDRAGEFDAGRARADDPERQGRAARLFVCPRTRPTRRPGGCAAAAPWRPRCSSSPARSRPTRRGRSRRASPRPPG